MNLESKYVEDENGVKFAPITTPQSVRWPNGDDLDDKIASLYPFQKTLSVDFQENADTAQFINLYGPITIVRAAGVNVASLKISYGSVVQQSVTLGTVDIDVADGDTVILEITRTTDSQDAVVALKFIQQTS